MKTRKVFTKMDLCWGYNNVQIKEGDKQKTVFIIHIEVYKPSIMFLNLTNSLATFQVMINDILRDLINTGDVAAFMNDILVERKDKKRYNKIVEEILRRIKADDLYIKPKKYMWKIKEINFLELIMKVDRIKIQEEKVVEVLE